MTFQSQPNEIILARPEEPQRTSGLVILHFTFENNGGYNDRQR